MYQHDLSQFFIHYSKGGSTIYNSEYYRSSAFPDNSDHVHKLGTAWLKTYLQSPKPKPQRRWE